MQNDISKDWSWGNDPNNTPSLQSEYEAVQKSAREAELEKTRVANSLYGGGKKSAGDRLVGIVENQVGLTLFHNELKDPYVQMPIAGHKEIWSCKSKMFKRWLAKIFRETYQKTPANDAINTAITVLEGKASFDGPEHVLHNRIAWHDGAIWYDLADPEWRVLKITPAGWEIIIDPPILFRRYSHQRAQVEPACDGNAKELLKFLNIQDEDQKLLLLVWVVSCFIPDFPHPIPIFYGAQGSAKSLLCKLLRKVIDPSAIEVASFPNDTNEFVQILAHHYCIFFDNVSRLPDHVSDTLCKAVTGDGFSKRELYSDDDDIIFAFKRCLGINGINLSAKNPDLLERSILFELERVPPEQRKREQELLQEFENERPRIVGGIFDAVAKAMQIKPSIQLDSLPRMADFVVWGCAIAEALGYTKKQFLDAYYRDIKSKNEEVLYESLVATIVIELMGTRDAWEGSPSELLKEMTSLADGLGINTTQEREWPKAANALSRRLNKLKTNLADAEIKVGDRVENKRRLIYLSKNSRDLSLDGNDRNDVYPDTNGAVHTSEALQENC